jgi:hypothetical protein
MRRLYKLFGVKGLMWDSLLYYMCVCVYAWTCLWIYHPVSGEFSMKAKLNLLPPPPGWFRQ